MSMNIIIKEKASPLPQETLSESDTEITQLEGYLWSKSTYIEDKQTWEKSIEDPFPRDLMTQIKSLLKTAMKE